MKNTTPQALFPSSTIRIQSQRRSSYAKLGIRGAILNAVAALATACVDDPGSFKPGREVSASVASDAGNTEASGSPDSSTAADTFMSETTADDGTSVDTAPAETPDVNQPIDTGITPDIKADTDTNTPPSDSSSPTPDVKTDTQKPDSGSTVKQYKFAPPDQTMSTFVKGMELPVQQVFVVTKGKVYDAFEAFGHKPGVTPWKNSFSETVNGADVYTLKMADLPQNPAVAGQGNFRVVTVSLPAGTKSGTYIDSLTGKKAQDGVTPLYDRAPILPVLCGGAEYSAEDAKLLAEAMTMTGKMEFNDNLEMMRDTYLAFLQQKINMIFANAGKSYAPQCTVQLVTPGDVKKVDGQDCPQGCLYAMVSVQPIAKWTELIQKQ